MNLDFMLAVGYNFPVILAHRIRLTPNNVQASWFERCSGTARFTWNWGLARWQALYAAGEKPSWQALNRELNARKAAEFPWMRELPWKIANTALSDLGQAFANFSRRVKAGERKPGYPRFKSRKRSTPSFCIEGRALTFDGRRVKIPKLGWVRLREALRFPGKALSARFTKRAGHWFVAVQVEVDETRWSYPHRCETQAAVGVDLGLCDLAVLSDGTKVPAPRALRRCEAKLRMLGKRLSRRKQGGANWRKAKARLARLHERIAAIRHAATHALTAYLVKTYRFIGIEDLNVRGMLANHRLAKSVADAALFEIRRQLGYKAPLAGSEVVVADRWFTSSKTCSVCGSVYADLQLGERFWTCDACGAVHDRDANAAKNLKTMALAHRVVACCPGSADDNPSVIVKLPAGQEEGRCRVNL